MARHRSKMKHSHRAEATRKPHRRRRRKMTEKVKRYLASRRVHRGERPHAKLDRGKRRHHEGRRKRRRPYTHSRHAETRALERVYEAAKREYHDLGDQVRAAHAAERE